MQTCGFAKKKKKNVNLRSSKASSSAKTCCVELCSCVVVWLCKHMPNAPPSWRGWFMLHANPRGKLRVMAASNLRPFGINVSM